MQLFFVFASVCVNIFFCIGWSCYIVGKQLLLAIALFILYLLGFCWLITRIRFFTQAGLSKPILIALFICKIAAAIVYAWFYNLPQYYAGSDTWRFFEQSKSETDLLLTNPAGFVSDIFHHGYSSSGNIFYGHNTYWNDLKSNVVIKLMAIFNVFTFKSYYANIIFFNFIFFFGPVAFYRVMKEVFIQKKILMTATIFLLPSFVFWCSGVHKDGLIFCCLALIIYYFYGQLKAKKIIPVPFIICIFCFLLLFALRNFICLLLVPSLVVWCICHFWGSQKILAVAGVYGLCILLFFVLPYVNSSLNFPQYAVEKQNEFKQLEGNAQIPVKQLQPNFASFVKFLPSALDIALLRPHISEIRNASYLPAICELFLLWFLTGLFFFSKKNLPVNGQHIALVIFCFCFAFSYLLLSGYTITNSGAIVRYKSLVLPLIFCPLICMANITDRLIIKNS